MCTVYIYIYICMYTSIFVQFTYIYICMYTSICINVYVYILYIYIYVCVHPYVNRCNIFKHIHCLSMYTLYSNVLIVYLYIVFRIWCILSLYIIYIYVRIFVYTKDITPMIVCTYVVVYRYMMYKDNIRNVLCIKTVYIIYLYTTTYIHTIIGVIFSYIFII